MNFGELTARLNPLALKLNQTFSQAKQFASEKFGTAESGVSGLNPFTDFDQIA